MKWKSCREFPKKHGWYIAKAVHDSDKPFIRVIKTYDYGNGVLRWEDIEWERLDEWVWLDQEFDETQEWREECERLAEAVDYWQRQYFLMDGNHEIGKGKLDNL